VSAVTLLVKVFLIKMSAVTLLVKVFLNGKLFQHVMNIEL